MLSNRAGNFSISGSITHNSAYFRTLHMNEYAVHSIFVPLGFRPRVKAIDSHQSKDNSPLGRTRILKNPHGLNSKEGSDKQTRSGPLYLHT